ncbi:cation-translocating P-type ATPase [Halomicronema sp. CCY15110]|uniref:cation-translocating P-type ATPase n=1 Tax=Halomicronema sp. CCY15110 TaxID=2767773 RepID=UPI00194FE1C6|nr:cation-translocating P-type ATPase [Halomicronema sp. CCY15110]
MSDWYKLHTSEVLQQLDTDVAQGLGQTEAIHRLQQYGPNELTEQPGESLWQILWKQLRATMVVVLIVAALISLALQDYINATAIFAIVAFNAILGVRQEYQAGQAIAALKKLAVATVKVRRDGHVQEISARQLVPGDIVLLETGNLVAADYRLLETANLRIQESSLTGEAEPTIKQSQPLERGPLVGKSQVEVALGDRPTMAYMGTTITYGRGLGVVTETGNQTELGQIAIAIQTVQPKPTPLEQRLDQLGSRLAIITIGLVAIIFGLGLLRGEALSLMFLVAVSLAVAAVPEGLPAVVTITLALGAKRMLKQQALIRKLPAVETLGSVAVICSDKTGTLTENRMTATFLAIDGHRVDLTTPLGRAGLDTYDDLSGVLQAEPSLTWLLTGAVLCNDAMLERHPQMPHQVHTVGDPTEGALVMTAARLGLSKTTLEQALPRVAERPFEADRKRMTTVHQLPISPTPLPAALTLLVSELSNVSDATAIAFTKGSVDSLLAVASHVWVKGHSHPLDRAVRQQILADNDQLARNGMRVLGVAFRLLNAPIIVDSDGNLPGGTMLETDLTFIGLVGIIDPVRPEVKAAVLTCQAAGIRPVMITGDHPLTAQSIARELGIVPNETILTGPELSQLSSRALQQHVDEISVYARVSPQHKLDIVQALQSQGHIVAMTGDGVNDAPALKQADIGIAMGITGTDVAKDAADMVLLDDNFATIVAAIREGRVIYDNIRKFINYTLTGNAGELWVILLAPFLGMPLPLIPLQILWVNLLADGLLALALSVEPPERAIMQRSPRPPTESIFSRGVGWGIVWVGLLLGLILLAIAYGYWSTGQATWQTMVFTTLALSRVWLAETMRSERDSLFQLGLLSNRPLLGAVALTIGLQLIVIYSPVLQPIFQTTALSVRELAISLGLSTVVFWAIELQKWWIRYQPRTRKPAPVLNP